MADTITHICNADTVKVMRYLHYLLSSGYSFSVACHTDRIEVTTSRDADKPLKLEGGRS